MFLTPSSGSGTLRFAITTNGAGAEQILESTSALAVGTWQHVAVTRQGNTGRLYLNGALVASQSVTISPRSINPALNYLGESQYEADPLFEGRLDELYVYNYALNPTEIARLTENQPPTLDGLQLPGDCNEDGGLDLSDAVCLLGNLFLGAPTTLPCDEGNSSANTTLLDSNGDGGVDLSDVVFVLTFLFLGGPPPILGLECTPIPGCPPNPNCP
jgi:hypothetical protein